MTQPTREEVQEASSADKGSFQRMKCNYILNNLHVLGNDICGEGNEVRFSVVDENETVIRQGVHTTSDSGNVTTVSTKSSTPQRHPAPTITPSASTSPPGSSPATTGRQITRQKPNPPEVIVIDDSSSDEEHKSQANDSDSEDDIRVPSLKTRRRTGPVKQEPVYIEIKDEETESE